MESHSIFNYYQLSSSNSNNIFPLLIMGNSDKLLYGTYIILDFLHSLESFLVGRKNASTFETTIIHVLNLAYMKK